MAYRVVKVIVKNEEVFYEIKNIKTGNKRIIDKETKINYYKNGWIVK